MCGLSAPHEYVDHIEAVRIEEGGEEYSPALHAREAFVQAIDALVGSRVTHNE